MGSRRHPQVINLDEVEVMERPKGRFAPRSKRLASPAGAKAIACNWMELQPGKTSFPFHYHTGIEEGIYVLSGSGELRLGVEKVQVRAGDYTAFPAGPESAHTLTIFGKLPLQYLVLSTTATTDIVGYPDSKKFGFSAMPDPTTWPNGVWVRKLVKDQESVDYYEGEDTSEHSEKRR